MVYTPICFVVFAMWYWDQQTGDNTMAIFDEILEWLDINDRWVTAIALLAAAVIGVLQAISKLRNSNKDIRSIKQVADTAPKDITTHVDAAKNEICNSMVENKVVLAQMNARTEGIAQQLTAVMVQRSEAPVQQSQLLSEISSLYALHDNYQHIISEQRDEIQRLKDQNAKLEQQNKRLRNELKELRPESHFEHRLR